MIGIYAHHHGSGHVRALSVAAALDERREAEGLVDAAVLDLADEVRGEVDVELHFRCVGHARILAN